MPVNPATKSWLWHIDEGVRARVYEKFQAEMGFTDLKKDTAIYPKEVALRKISEKRGEVGLEFANVWRTETNIDWTRQRTPLARSGLYVQDPSSAAKTVNVKAMPVQLRYMVWFWSLDYDRLNAVTSKYIFWQQEDPYISLLYEGTYPIDLYLSVGNVGNESPLDLMFNEGQYFVIGLPINVEGWVLASPSGDGIIKKIIVMAYADNPPQVAGQIIHECDECEI